MEAPGFSLPIGGREQNYTDNSPLIICVPRRGSPAGGVDTYKGAAPILGPRKGRADVRTSRYMLKKKHKVTKGPVLESVAENELTPKEQLFVDGYLGEAHFNATKAMRLAGYKGNNNVLAVSAYRLLRKPKIAAQILERLNEHAMSSNEVLARLSKQARGSLADVLNADGEFDLKAARKNGSHELLKKLKIKKTILVGSESGTHVQEVNYEFEIHDPQAALVQLGKYHKLFVDRTEHTGKDGGPLLQPVADAIEKVYGQPDKP